MMTDYEYHKLNAQLAILKDVEKTYPTSTIQNAITQIAARIEEAKKQSDGVFGEL